MRAWLVAALFAVSTPAAAETISVDSPRWALQGAEAGVVEFQGRQALHLRGAIASLTDANFDTGVIAFDMALPSTARSFPGIYFRGQDEFNYEHFYLRPHQSGNPDANQYTPVINGMTGWQIYSEYNGQMRYRVNEWFHVRLEIAEDSARIFVDSDTPSLIVHDLKRDRQAGYIQLRGSLGGAYFSNVTVVHGDVEGVPPAAAVALPTGLVRTWAVSGAMAEFDALAVAAGARRLPAAAWTPLRVETNGIVNLARVAVRSDETPTVLSRIAVRADRARTVPMRFGFSDSVHIFLNGALLYSGDDTQASRDYRFLGTVGLHDVLHLPLRRGANEIVFAVSEAAGLTAPGGGGWAAMAAFEDPAGLTVETPR